MTRSDEPLFDPRIADWLEDDPYTAPNQALDVVLAAFPSIKQRRALRVPWRFPQMSTAMKLAGVAAAIAIAIVGGSWLINRQPGQPGVGGQPTPSSAPSVSPSPSASPSPRPGASATPIDTAAWTTYTSSRYGFSIAHPDDWAEDPADSDWTFENDIEAWLSKATESFVNAEGSVKVSAWSVAVTPGTTVEGWMEAYCTAQNAGPCTYLQDLAVDAETRDQRPGLLVSGPGKDTMAFFLDGQTVYVVAAWRDEIDPSVQPYGGARRLLEAFVSTMTLQAKPPQGSPGAS